MNKPYRLGVNAIIIDSENKFLIIQKNAYKDTEWNFLGGGRDPGETLEDNLFRELKEELDAEKDCFKQLGVSAHKIQYDYPVDIASTINGGKYRGVIYDQVLLRFTGGKRSLVFTPLEFKAHKWVTGSDLATHLIFPNQYDNHKKAIDEIIPGTI